MTLVSFGGWNFPRRRVVDDCVGTRDGLTPELHLLASKLVERFQPVLELFNLSRAQTPCYGAKGNIKAIML